MFKKKTRNNKKYNCQYCDFHTSHKGDWEKHLATQKCIKNHSKYEKKPSKKFHLCKKCHKKYKNCNGLWYHNKKYHAEIFQKKKPKKPKKKPKNPDLSGEKMIIDKNEYIKLKAAAAANINIGTQNNIKTQNNNISINVFLNEHCKDAICLEDFITNIKATLKDLINTEQDGHVKGISNIITKGLLDMPSTDRPIHSTDLKRNKFVVKKEEGWEKDDGTEVDKAVQNVKFKLVGPALTEWEENHPDYQNNSKELDEWQKMLAVTVPNDKEKAMYAIKKNIAQAVPIKDAINEIKE